jgi:hypothetical protein
MSNREPRAFLVTENMAKVAKLTDDMMVYLEAQGFGVQPVDATRVARKLVLVGSEVPNPARSGQVGPWPVRSGESEAIVPILAIANQASPASGYLKRCDSCERRIYMQPDLNGFWRPYESWADGHAAEREWRLHRCTS